MHAIFLRQEHGVTLNVYVQPGSGKDQFVGTYLGRLKLKVKAKATDGKANEDVLRFVAKCFGVSRSCVVIIRGTSSREKTLEIAGDPAVLGDIAEKLVGY
jgi:uncharacterized protein (TIGR00251 family)